MSILAINIPWEEFWRRQCYVTRRYDGQVGNVSVVFPLKKEV